MSVRCFGEMTVFLDHLNSKVVRVAESSRTVSHEIILERKFESKGLQQVAGQSLFGMWWECSVTVSICKRKTVQNNYVASKIMAIQIKRRPTKIEN